MRDRLIELLKSPHKAEQLRQKGVTIGKYEGDCVEAMVADFLLANGVIVPPCKVGDIIYALTYNRKDYMPLKVTSLESLVRWMDEDQFGHSLFTTREEAEQALKGGAE